MYFCAATCLLPVLLFSPYHRTGDYLPSSATFLFYLPCHFWTGTCLPTYSWDYFTQCSSVLYPPAATYLLLLLPPRACGMPARHHDTCHHPCPPQAFPHLQATWGCCACHLPALPPGLGPCPSTTCFLPATHALPPTCQPANLTWDILGH